MKRIALLVLFLTLTSFVRAEELETILQDEESLSGTGRSAFAKIDITDGDTVEAIINNLAPGQPFSIVGDVISLVTQEDEHNYLDFTPYNKWLASPFVWLMPGQFKISKPYVPFTTPQRGSAHYGAVLSISGFDIITVVSDCYTTNDNPPELSQGLPDRPKFYENAQSLSSLWSGAKLVTKDGRVVFDWPSFPVKKINQEDCGRKDLYEEVKPKISDMTVRAKFSEGEIVSRVIDTIIDKIIDLASGAVEYVYRKLNVHLTAEVTQKLKTDGNGFFALFDYESNGRETTEVISNQTRTKNDGMVSTFVPFKLRKNPVGFAGTDNVIKLTGSYANDGKDYVSREVGANRAYQNGRQAACPVYSYQILKGKGPVKEAFKIGGVVPTDCSPPPSPTPGAEALGDVCEVAEAYNIPCCQLEGIMAIESDSGANTGSGSCSTSKGNFNCCSGVGCGPAQISCGQYDAYAGKDKLDLCDPVGAAELLARAMLLKLCQAAGQCQSYDWTTEGKTAMKYKVSDGDYTAAAYFHGLANGCTVSGCTQYRWGADKGYCDAVENYCTTGQVLPDNTSPEFCAQCNEEVVRSGLPPMQCTQ